MRTDSLGYPLYHDLWLGGHQSLANFPEMFLSLVRAVLSSGLPWGYIGTTLGLPLDYLGTTLGLHLDYLGFLKHCLLGTGTEATTGTFSQL